MPAVTAALIAMVRQYEGCRLEVYDDPAGHPTIGIGHKIRPGETFTRIDMEKAEELLRQDLKYAEKAVLRRVNSEKLKQLNDDQYSALVDWFFNVGDNRHTRESTLLKKVNAGRFNLVPSEFGRWVFGRDGEGRRVALPGLIKRRADCALMWIGSYRP